MMEVESMNTRNMRTISEPQGFTQICTIYSCGSYVPLAPHMEDNRDYEASSSFLPACGASRQHVFCGETRAAGRDLCFRISPPTPLPTFMLIEREGMCVFINRWQSWERPLLRWVSERLANHVPTHVVER